MDERTRRDFLEKYSKNQHTEQEHELFLEWLESLNDDELKSSLAQYGQYFSKMPDQEPVQHIELWNKIEAQLVGAAPEPDQHPVPQSSYPFKRIISVAAAILLLISIAIYLKKDFNQAPVATDQLALNKISPGGNKAILTLADGSEIILETAKNGVLASQRNMTVDKATDGKIIYNASTTLASPGAAHSEYNTISTPYGGQYQVILPDGTQVWLNAGSSLKFPVSFTGKERNVELSGEAYFEVAKNKNQPFKVLVNQSTVEVLGTHFNVMGYKDEKTTNTTLLEGAVRIVSGKESRLIAPNEQAMVNGQIKVLKVNALESIEWRNGKFNFGHSDIKTIMRKVARWYNVDIEYRGAVTNEGFVGTVPRSESISEVLKTLELTGLVHFKLEGRSVIVMP